MAIVLMWWDRAIARSTKNWLVYYVRSSKHM